MKPVVSVLNDIRSLYNVGSIFRTSDALGVHKLYLCGLTGTPEHRRMAHFQKRDPDSYPVAKTALAALETFPWEYKKSALRTVKDLKKQGYYVIALELTDTSKPIHPIPQRPLAIVVGHERTGVDKRILDLADEVLHIPMRGRGSSMNVAVAYGIGVWKITR